MAETEHAHQHGPGTVIGPGGTTSPVITSDRATEQELAAVHGGQQDGDQFTDDDSITWTASEFVAHQKSVGWYMVLTGATLAVAVIVYLVTKDIISTAVVLLVAVAFGFLASRQPRQLGYRLGTTGFDIGRRHYELDSFRSFAVVDEGAFSSIIFMPLKRFAPLTTIYYAPEDEEEIIGRLSDTLPLEEYRHDVVDRFLHRIRF